MTLDQFIALQTELFEAFGWFVRWWLILFAVAGIVATSILATILSRGMIDKT